MADQFTAQHEELIERMVKKSRPPMSAHKRRLVLKPQARRDIQGVLLINQTQWGRERLGPGQSCAVSVLAGD